MPGAARAGLRDLAGLHHFDPDGQVWARAMADLLIDANAAATAARNAGQASLASTDLGQLPGPLPRRRQAKGITDNQRKRTRMGKGSGWPAGTATTRT